MKHLTLPASGSTTGNCQKKYKSWPTFPRQPANGGDRDAFIVQPDPDASGLLFGTYFGSSGDEFDDPVHTSIGFDFTSGGLHLAAGTGSADLPKTTGAYDVSYNGGAYGGFVARLNPFSSSPAVEIAMWT